MKTALIIMAALLLMGCTRHYHVLIIGDNNAIEVTASVPKQIEASLEGHVSGAGL